MKVALKGMMMVSAGIQNGLVIMKNVRIDTRFVLECILITGEGLQGNTSTSTPLP